MSAGDIDTLAKLWAATLAPHGAVPPFTNHKDLYDTIDSTPLADVPWQTFDITYNGKLPDHDVPHWMTATHSSWFRDPRQLVRNILSNPDFKDDIDWTPFHEYDSKGDHRFQNFMSGDWAWRQAVRAISIISLCYY